jgi:hypothetical protein
MNLMSELNNQPLNSNILEYGSCLIPLKLRQIDVHLHDGLEVVSACGKAGISDKSCYFWRKTF